MSIDIASLDPQNTIVVATGNPHKVTEIAAILGPVVKDMRLIALGELGDFPDPVEDGATFYDNAYIKAAAALDCTGLQMAIADDSGLCVDVLGGAPGILSARYAGVHGDDVANNRKLLQELEAVSAEKRSAHFHSSVVLVERDEDGEGVIAGHGDCPGMIAFEPRGSQGFGYDPLFLPNDTPGKTMAELTPEEKNAISHRYRALQDLARLL